MVKAHSALGRVVLILGGSLFASAGVEAQAPRDIPLGLNVGSFHYTVNSHIESCDLDLNYSDQHWDYADMSYTSVDGVQHSLTGQTTYYIKSGPGSPCPTTAGPTISYQGADYTLVIVPQVNSLRVTVTVPGYINPKYVVVGVVYAPPGSSSNVDYSTSNLVSSTVTTKNTFSTGYTQTSTSMFSRNIKAWKNGTIDASAQASTSYTHSTTTTDSTAVTVEQSIGLSRDYPGPACDYCGVDHDYDQILVWLNPVMLYTLTNNGVVQSNGYGFSTWDQPGVDVYPVYVGELNGDFAMRGSTTTAFSRSWASALSWPSGEGPGLTAQDQQNILKMDPYWNCTYMSPVSDTTDCAKPPDSARFTQTTNQNFPYSQPIPGGQPNSTTYHESYTDTNVQGLTHTVEDDHTVSYEHSLGGSIFGIGFKMSVNNSTTIKYIYETSSEFKSSTTSEAKALITEPRCNVVNGVCSPVYPPPNAYNPVTCSPLQLPTAFGQGNNMYIYQDNLFGTFLVEPYGQP